MQNLDILTQKNVSILDANAISAGHRVVRVTGHLAYSATGQCTDSM